MSGGTDFCSYFLGGVVWNLDNHVCAGLTRLREEASGRPASHLMRPLTQLHAWWHFFSGYGTYLFIVAFTGIRQR